MHFQSPQWTEHRLRVVTHEALKIRIVRLVIGNPQAAPRIHILNAMAIPPKSANQFCHTLHGGRKRIEVGNLSSDLHADAGNLQRSEEHTSELQSLTNLVCRLLLEKKKK